MKNIFLVFIQDLKRISTNVVAIVVLIGLTVIPSLYAWFNTLSNWDPYGTESTSRIKVAVASDDPGVTIDGVTVNFGDQIISNLKANTTIGWVFTDSTQEAIDGVYSGDYYAALVLPSDFTSDMVSFLSDSLEHPQIQYYCNQKKNAIAPKITDKAKKAVQSQTNSTFVNTLTKSLVSASSAAITVDFDSLTLDDTTGNSLIDVISGKLTDALHRFLPMFPLLRAVLHRIYRKHWIHRQENLPPCKSFWMPIQFLPCQRFPLHFRKMYPLSAV